MKFGYTIVYVSSVTDTLNFYKDAFGVETRFLDESGQYGELNTGDTVLAFASHDMGEMNLNGHYQRTNLDAVPFGVELAFVTDDVASAYTRAVAAGAVAIKAPAQKP
jgi:lactoylglutathione lyase